MELITTLSTPTTSSPADAASKPGIDQARATARQFEEVFVRMMLQEMRKSVSTDAEGSLFGSGPGSSTYEGWFDTHMAEHLTGNRGIGLADVMIEQWQRRGLVANDAGKQEGTDADD